MSWDQLQLLVVTQDSKITVAYYHRNVFPFHIEAWHQQLTDIVALFHTDLANPNSVAMLFPASLGHSQCTRGLRRLVCSRKQEKNVPPIFIRKALRSCPIALVPILS